MTWAPGWPTVLSRARRVPESFGPPRCGGWASGCSSCMMAAPRTCASRFWRIRAKARKRTPSSSASIACRSTSSRMFSTFCVPCNQERKAVGLTISSLVEAHAHLTTGLEILLATVPETPVRHQHELNLLIDLAQVLSHTKGQGAPELEPVLTRAAALCQQVGETPQRVAV